MADTHDIAGLIGRAALRDRRAFALLYDATAPKLFAVCLRMLRDRAQAEDALQEVYVKVWANAARFRPSDRDPMFWLVAIARYHAIDLLRARPPAAVDIDTAPEMADAGPDPEAHAILASEGERIGRCMGELPADRAAAVRAAYVDGYSYEELARRHSVPLNTMRTWLRRGLISLRQCLERPD